MSELSGSEVRRDLSDGTSNMLLIGTAIAWALLPAPLIFGAGAGDKPNVVLIFVDDMGWADLGCFGSQYYETPNIDRLCAQGMQLTDAYAACTVCSPSRASILTGRYPTRTGITQWIHGGANRKGEGYQTSSRKKLLEPINQGYLEPHELTLAELLKEAGYVSCHVGKWHLGGRGHSPLENGFDYNFGGCDRGSPPSYLGPSQVQLPGLELNEDDYLTDRESDAAVGFIRKHQNELLLRTSG